MSGNDHVSGIIAPLFSQNTPISVSVFQHKLSFLKVFVHNTDRHSDKIRFSSKPKIISCDGCKSFVITLQIMESLLYSFIYSRRKIMLDT